MNFRIVKMEAKQKENLLKGVSAYAYFVDIIGKW